MADFCFKGKRLAHFYKALVEATQTINQCSGPHHVHTVFRVVYKGNAVRDVPETERKAFGLKRIDDAGKALYCSRLEASSKSARWEKIPSVTR